MGVKKSALFAAGVAIVSGGLLTLVNGWPTLEQAWKGGGSMFIAAFVILFFFGS